MYKFKKLFLIVFFLTLTIKYFSYRIMAQERYCYGTARNEDWFFDFSAINTETTLKFSFSKRWDDTILQRYIFDGYSWRVTNSFYSESADSETILASKTYTEAKDFIVAGGWIYQDGSGNIKSIICKAPLRVFEREMRLVGTWAGLIYPPEYQYDDLVIRGNKKYIGVAGNENYRGPNPCGNLYYPDVEPLPLACVDNKDYSPITDWRVVLLETGKAYYIKPPQTSLIDLTKISPYKSGDSFIFPSLPTQLTLRLFPATFAENQGTGARAYISGDDLIIYSRDNPANQPPEPPPLIHCSSVYGYVKDATNTSDDNLMPGISGVSVYAHGVDNSSGSYCRGGQTGCSTVTTGDNGRFDITCSTDMACLKVMVDDVSVQNKGYTVSGVFPEPLIPKGPTESVAWDYYTVAYKTPQIGSCGPFYFYYKQGPPPTPTSTPTPTPAPRAWFQVENGDIYSGEGISSQVPSGNYLINSSPGGLAIAKSEIYLGSAQKVSPDSNWQIASYSKSFNVNSYSSLRRQAKLLYSETEKKFSPAQKDIQDLNTGVYYTTEDLTINSRQTINNGKRIIIFVGTEDSPKNLYINQNITVDNTSALLIAVSKNMEISPEVNEVYGFYYVAGINDLTGGHISTGTKGDKNDIQLRIYGGLTAANNVEINLQRDLGDLQNQTTPGEIITLLPRYLIAFNSLWKDYVTNWREVVP